MKPPPKISPVRRKGSFLRTAKLVFWSFAGLRARSESELDVEQLNPVHIIVMGLLGVALLVGVLIAVATFVVAG